MKTPGTYRTEETKVELGGDFFTVVDRLCGGPYVPASMDLRVYIRGEEQLFRVIMAGAPVGTTIPFDVLEGPRMADGSWSPGEKPTSIDRAFARASRARLRGQWRSR